MWESDGRAHSGHRARADRRFAAAGARRHRTRRARATTPIRPPGRWPAPPPPRPRPAGAGRSPARYGTPRPAPTSWCSRCRCPPWVPSSTSWPAPGSAGSSPTSPRSSPPYATRSTSGRGGSGSWPGSSAGTRWPDGRRPASPAADPALFDGCAWVLCLEPGETDLADWLTLAGLLTTLGARVVPTTAAEHDRAVAAVSHVPHLLAAALAAHAAGDPAGTDPGRRLVPGRYPGGRQPAGPDRRDVRWQRGRRPRGTRRASSNRSVPHGKRWTPPIRSAPSCRGYSPGRRRGRRGRRYRASRPPCPSTLTCCCAWAHGGLGLRGLGGSADGHRGPSTSGERPATGKRPPGITRRSVTIAVTSPAGVTSKAGLTAPAPAGAVR